MRKLSEQPDVSEGRSSTVSETRELRDPHGRPSGQPSSRPSEPSEPSRTSSSSDDTRRYRRPSNPSFKAPASAAQPAPREPSAVVARSVSAEVLTQNAEAVPFPLQASSPRVDMWLWAVMAVGLFAIAAWMVSYSAL